MNIYEKLLKVQSALKAPKNQYNDFGKYHFRNCEDILESVKPLLIENGLVLILSDNIVTKGEKNYVEASALLVNTEEPVENHKVTAYAREPENKKGMDDSQLTGTASSYARKYALNGLFDIDDAKDPDTPEYTKITKDTESKVPVKKAVKKTEAKKVEANLTDISKPMLFGKYKEKTWVEVYTEDKQYLEDLVTNCKSEKGKKIYGDLISQVKESFITVSDEDIENIFGGNLDE